MTFVTQAHHLNLLFFGDIFGEPGRLGLRQTLPQLREHYQPDIVFANCENASHGRGVSNRVMKDLLSMGVDWMTSGNHIFRVDDIYSVLNQPECRVLRPYNFSKNAPGRGAAIAVTKRGHRIGLINLMGRAFMDPGVNLPFDAVDEALAELKSEVDVIVVDMHAETTAEKRALAWYLDGKVQLVVGTHTHVPTADEEVLPAGTAYITDLGMCGPFNSVIGMSKEGVIKRMRTGLPTRFEVAEGDVRVCGIFCQIDLAARRALKIERIQVRPGQNV
jgi:metallophosphoesterase (TIGR00282 family)